MSSIRAALLALLVAAPASAQAIPRTPDGKPDLHGNWTTPWTTTLERAPGGGALVVSPEQGAALHAQFIDRLHTGDPLGASYIWDLAGPLTIRGEIRSSFIVDPPDGRIPYTEAGQARRAQYQLASETDDPEQRFLTERCLIAGNGYAPFLTIPGSNLRQIVQTADDMLFFTEAFGQLRLVPLDGRVGPVIPRGGASKGRWDGDTLVIETTGLLETDAFRAAPLSTFAISPATRITERLAFIGPDEILYRYMVEDASLYIRPWIGESVLKRSSDRIFEWACHEGNYGLANILLGARVAEERAAKAKEQKGKP